MEHTCKYCQKRFEGRANAETCSASCRIAYNHVTKYALIWGIELTPKLPKPQETKEIKPKESAKPGKWDGKLLRRK